MSPKKMNVTERFSDRVADYDLYRPSNPVAHRTIEDHLGTLSGTGFKLERLKEADPLSDNFADTELLRRRKRIPLFLLIAAQRVKP